MEIYIKTCYDNLVRLTGDFFFGRNRGVVFVSNCGHNDERTFVFVSGEESNSLNEKYHIELAPETYARYILEELEIKILDNIGKLETLVIDYRDILNTVLNYRIPNDIKEGKIKQ